MLKRIGKKALPVIMSTMLVAGMGAVSTSAVEVATENSTVVTEDATLSTYVDKTTGIKFESSSIELNSENVYVVDDTAIDEEYGYGLALKSFYIDVYDAPNSYSSVNFKENPVTAYIPYEDEDCSIMFMNVWSEKPLQLETEYVDGYYKVQLVELGNYSIYSEPLAEGEGELVEQSLVHEKTGVTVSGMIRTNSKLGVREAKDRFGGLLNLDYDVIMVPLYEEDFEEYGRMTAYEVNLLRNLDIIKAESNLTVTLPCEIEDCEVRYITDSIDFTASQEEAYEKIENELWKPTKSDEEIADMINSLVEDIYPVMEADYVDGSYSVNTDKLGTFFIMPKGSFTFTAENVKHLKEDIYSDLSDNPDPPMPEDSEEPTEVVATEPATKAEQTATQNTTATQATTAQATTAQTTGKGTVATGNGANVFALAIALGVVTSAILTFRKKRLSK
ncbi:MAG: hypothetical protein UHY68_08455 [Acutalibacteraceae bacterium]|nr:hypothetical protein [Acutalibacteraceae bacterium]